MQRGQNNNLNDRKGQRGNMFLYGEKLKGELNTEAQMSTNFHQKKKKNPYQINRKEEIGERVT